MNRIANNETTKDQNDLASRYPVDGVVVIYGPAPRMVAFEKDWADRHDLPIETLAQYRHSDGSGYRLPGLSKNYRTWCNAIDSVVVELPPMNPSAGRLVATLAKSMHTQYVKAIEASGAKVAQ